ncbi:MAG: heavy metal translocating P-type ATPase [Armatimonadota bacterium]|nr:heavy metal translocating P-type ATPase [Armatimonadota bacterium]
MADHHVHPHPEAPRPPAADRHAGHTPEMFRNRLWVCVVLTVPILAVSDHVRSWLGLPPVRFPGLVWLEPVLATAVYLYGAGPFVAGAVREARGRAPGMMTLVALATTVAYGYSLATTLGLPGEPFYWELATLVVVMLLGHWIEMRAVHGASRALEHLASLLPPVAHRVRDDEVEDVPVEALRVGDVVLVRPGEQIPADGVVVEGSSTVNEAFLTGESRPVPKAPDVEVVAGAVNGEGALRVRVLRTGDDTALNQITRLVREAQGARSRYQVLADRTAAWLTYAAVGAGSATFGLWLASRAAPAFAVERAVTVLVIACPHALGLAIPLVVVNATALAARNGILVRNRESFERAREIRTVAFDKTGTLTEGQFGVRAVYADGLDEAEALRIAAALEAASAHPLARAIVDAARRRGLAVHAASDVQAIPGKGLEGTWDGRRYRVGRPEWAEELGVPGAGARLRDGLREAEARGESVVALMDAQRVYAVIALADRVRERAREAVRALHATGRRVVMVTGDADAVARTVARELGIDRYVARVLPQDKARIVRELRAQGPVAFVGDGINDAPALVEADLGMAIGAGTNVAIESADVVLVENDPLDAVRVLRLAAATYRKMVQNLVWATGYNVVAIPLAAGAAYRAGVVLSPAIGALFMSLSTVAVAANAVLLRRARLE